MTPSREMVRKASLLHIEEGNIVIEEQMDAINILLSIAELYLCASDAMPNKYHVMDELINDKDVLSVREAHRRGFNDALNQTAPLIMRLQGRVEELEARGK